MYEALLLKRVLVLIPNPTLLKAPDVTRLFSIMILETLFIDGQFDQIELNETSTPHDSWVVSNLCEFHKK